jgi:hypothetical protein
MKSPDQAVRSTIIIPNTVQPNYMHAALHGLVENSYYKHRIIVMWTDPDRFPDKAKVQDFEIIDGQRRQTFSNLRHFFDHHAKWLRDNGVEVIDVTDETVAFHDRHLARGCKFEGGTALAWINNFGVSMTDTEWAIPNWDADFYPGLHWDKPIFDYAQGCGSHSREYLIPMHVQPVLVTSDEAASWDTWRDSAKVAVHRMAIPTTKIVDGFAYVTAGEFQEFQDRYRRPGVTIREPCGLRARLHWVPWILRTEAFRSVGFNYQGSGYDLAFDNAMGAAGFTKVGFCDSFIVHKGYVLPECSVGA